MFYLLFSLIATFSFAISVFLIMTDIFVNQLLMNFGWFRILLARGKMDHAY